MRTAQTRQKCGNNKLDRCEYTFVWTPKKSLEHESGNDSAATQRTIFWQFFGELQRDSPFRFGRLIGPYGSIFQTAIKKLSTHHLLFRHFLLSSSIVATSYITIAPQAITKALDSIFTYKLKRCVKTI